MGTNYYHEVIEKPACEHCGRAADVRSEHIGKSSAGWTFTFHGTDEIENYQDWLRVLRAGGIIRDEYGRALSLQEFMELVESKRFEKFNHARKCSGRNDWLDDEGNSFSSGEFS